MKNIRIWFEKVNTAKYISHLDLSRCMARAIHKAKLPFWYTEGFNPHVFLTITMPISLGYTGLRESMDVKLLDDNYPFKDIIEKLNSGLPHEVKVYDVTEAVMKPGDVAYSQYQIFIDTENSTDLKEKFIKLLSRDEILVEKKSKKGINQVDIKPDFSKAEFDDSDASKLKILVILKSSNSGSINPKLLFDAYYAEYNESQELFADVVRINCFNADMEEFR